MKIKIFTNEYDYNTKEYRTFESEIHKSIDEYLVRTIVSDSGDVIPDKYLKIGDIVIPSHRLVAIKLEG